MKAFEDYLAFGRIGEKKIAQWLVNKGHAILPVYRIENDEDKKGPRLFLKGRELIVPDLLTFSKSKGACWIEAKHKTAFTWYRKTQSWQTGIDIYLLEQYIHVESITQWPVWILFLHSQDRSSERDEPWPCPTGLYGQIIEKLTAIEDHRYGGMVYWNEGDLIKLAEIDEL